MKFEAVQEIERYEPSVCSILDPATRLKKYGIAVIMTARKETLECETVECGRIRTIPWEQ
jgi:hypothetical protein